MVSPRPLVLPALLSLALLGGCTGSPPPEAQAPPAPPAAPPTGPAAAPAPAGKPAASTTERGQPAAAATGLVPLPSPRQVIAALPVGRRDPFEAPFPPLPPLPTGTPGGRAAGAPGTAPGTAGSAGAGTIPGRPLPPPPLTLPPGFRVTGLIRSGGTSEAVVEYGSLSGSLRPGDRGGRTTDLLPGGWTVAAVDVNRGRVTLQRGRQRVTAEL